MEGHLRQPTKKNVIQVQVFSIVTYESVSWTINVPRRKRIEATHMTCYRKLLGILRVARTRNKQKKNWSIFQSGCSESNYYLVKEEEDVIARSVTSAAVILRVALVTGSKWLWRQQHLMSRDKTIKRTSFNFILGYFFFSLISLDIGI